MLMGIQVSHPIYVSGVGTSFNHELNIVEKRIATVQDYEFTGGVRRIRYGENQISINFSKPFEKKLESRQVM